MKAPAWLMIAALGAFGSKTAPPTATPTAFDAAPARTLATVDAAAASTIPPPPPPDAAPPPPPDPAAIRAGLLAAEVAAYDAARPALERTCARCHVRGGKKASSGKLKHFDMSAYPFKGHHVTEVGPKLREVLGADGGKATMPKDDPEQVTSEELALMLALATAWDAAHAGEVDAAAPPE